MIEYNPQEENLSLRQAFKSAVDFLKLKGIENAEYDARELLIKAFDISKNDYFIKQNEICDEKYLKIFSGYINKRGKHVPLQLITEEAWFYGRCFYVDGNVLIPRGDTEILIEEALKYIENGMDVLDMCTGSGCIIITLAKEKNIKASGADISDKALRIARQNALFLEADCEFIKSDIFENVYSKYDMIVSNPPYIRTEEIKSLQTEVKDYDPMIALDGGTDGLDFYRRIIQEAGDHLNENGRLIFEIGFDEAKDVSKLLLGSGFSNINIVKDLSGFDRVVSAQRITE